MALSDLPEAVKANFESVISVNGDAWLTTTGKSTAEEQTVAGYSPSYYGESIFITDISNSDALFPHSSLGDFEATPDISDKYRARSGYYWTDATQGETDSDILGYVAKIQSSIPYISMRSHFKVLGKPQPVPNSFMHSKHYTLLEARDRSVADEIKAWNSTDFANMLKSEIKLNQWYSDHTLSATMLSTKKQINSTTSGLYTAYADIHGDYNFFIPFYEEVSNNAVVAETTLPNIYVFFAYNESENPNPDLQKHLSLGGLIKIKDHKALFMPNTQYEQDVAISPCGLYLDEWSRAYGKAIATGSGGYLAQKYKNILMPTGDMDMFTSQNQKKELFPMWMNVEFTTDSRTSFAEALKDSQLASTFQADLLNAVLNPSGPKGLSKVPTFEAKKISFQVSTATNIGASGAKTKTYFSSSERRVFDIVDWYEDLLNSTSDLDGMFDGYDTANSTFVGTYNNETKISNDPKYNLFKSLMGMVLTSKLREIVNNQQRTFSQVMKGESCQHETVLYRITKHAGPEEKGQPIQTFYLPNSNDIDVYQYIDTQVKYDKEYTYTIYGYELVIGTKYRHTMLEADSSYGKYALLETEVAPSLKMMEVPVYQYTTRVLDEAPVMPDAQFIPFRGINNKIRILLNGSAGRHTLMPEIIESQEATQINKFRKVQDVSADSPIVYETDDFAQFFQIWRTDKKPRSYRDFAGHLRDSISTDVNTETSQQATSATFDDKLKPNKKYYYCIRSIDNHGHISYPTPIYEVEMVDDKGSIYPLIKTVEFAEKIPRQTGRGMKRYMHIVPAMAQTLVNREKSGIDDTNTVIGSSPILGLSDDSLWGKKFKIRLTSKSTGKKIDLNLKFTHKHIKDKEG